MTRLAWASDIHLDCCKPVVREDFAVFAAEQSDALLITGDITNGSKLYLLADLALTYAKPVYFVLGNHDYWGGSFAGIRDEVRQLCSNDSNLYFLDECPPIDIADGVQLCGVGGWYDCQLGDVNSRMVLNDWYQISDLRMPYHRGHLVWKLRDLGEAAALEARAKLDATTAPTVLFATHIPPYREAAWHQGQPSDDEALPYYTCKAMGNMLSAWAAARGLAVNLITLCGHSHGHGVFQEQPNHQVRTAFADYGKPQIERIFEL